MPVLRAIRRVQGHLSPLLIDGTVALVLFVSMAAQFTRHLRTGQHPTTALTWALAVLLVAPILTHRRFPLASLAVCLTALLAYAAGRYAAFPGLPVFVLTFDIALHSKARVAFAALVASAAAMTVSLALQPNGVAALAEWVASGPAPVAWLVGRNLRYRRARWAELQDRAERLERERQEEARRAVTEERLRIARELHDVIAHSMSVIAVQSAVGHHVMDTQPDQARQALAAIEATSRSALTEMRRLLGVLRQDGQTRGSLAPAPGLADLDSLVSQVQDTGLRVWIKVDGQRGPVPPRHRPVGVPDHPGGAHQRDQARGLPVRYRHDLLSRRRGDRGDRRQGPSCARRRCRARQERLGPRDHRHARAGRGVRRAVHRRSRARWRLPGAGPVPGTGGGRLIRVVVADDQALVRGGFRVLVDSAPDLQVVGEASDGTEAVALARKQQPDVVLMDIRMPHLDGLEATRLICGSGETEGAKVLVLTTFDLDEYVYAALRAGASGFLLKDTPPNDLLAGIRVVAAGDALLAPSVTRQLISEFVRRPDSDRPPPATLDVLTSREREVLTLVARGWSNAEIAERLHLSPATAKTHVGRLLTKLEARDRTQLVVIAYETGLVTPGGPST